MSSSSSPSTPRTEYSETSRQSKLELKKQKKEAADAFWCPLVGVSAFSVEDIFNDKISLKGFQCKHSGTMVGSLYISEIAGRPLQKPQLIYGSPKLSYPYKKGTTEYLASFERDSRLSTINTYFLSQKWNGTNISFFKYRDHEDKLRITAKTKGCALLTDTQYGKFLTETLHALKVNCVEDLDLMGNPPEILREFVQTEAYQSITIEMCGQNIPHLVKYPFDIDLKPLFYTTHDGRIKPITNANGIVKHGPFPFSSSPEVIELCENLQQEALDANIEYRRKNGLQNKYEYEHFVAEGFVLYLCDTDGYLLNRIMYKIKPSDIEEVHWSKFDDNRRSQVKDVLKKMKERDLDIHNEELLRNELDMAAKEWKRFSKEVLSYIHELETVNDQAESSSAPQDHYAHSHRGHNNRTNGNSNSNNYRGARRQNRSATMGELHIPTERIPINRRSSFSSSSSSSSTSSPRSSHSPRGSPRGSPRLGNQMRGRHSPTHRGNSNNNGAFAPSRKLSSSWFEEKVRVN